MEMEWFWELIRLGVHSRNSEEHGVPELGVLLVLVVDARLGPRQDPLLAVKAFNEALDPGALQMPP